VSALCFTHGDGGEVGRMEEESERIKVVSGIARNEFLNSQKYKHMEYIFSSTNVE
jgi:hypothetical protein